MDFHSGLNLIKAQNGSGKSTILDAINFCLFGKPFRNIKMNQLINKYNDKNLEVYMTFKIGNDEYEIMRGLKPTLFELKKNGQSIDALSSKKLNQGEIDKLLGINERLFKNIVGIAVTNNKPFLSMSIGDKRALIESIFNIDILSEMGKEVKKRNTLDKSEQRLKITELDGYNGRIADNQANIEKIRNYIDQFEDNKKKELDKLSDEISKFDTKIKNNVKNIKLGEDKIESLKGKYEVPSDAEFASIAKSLGVAEHERATITKTLKTIGNATECPICGSTLDEGHAKEHLDKLKADLKVLDEDTIPNLKKLESEYNAKKNAALENQKIIDEITDRVKEQIFNKGLYEKSIEDLKKKIDEIKNKKCELTLDEQQKLIDELNEKVEILQNNISEITHKIEIDNKLIDVLGDEGLRMYFFKKLLPVLNGKINHYLQKFELPVTLEFDSFMNETIKTGRFEQQYNQFSGGERSRIDMAILLSFFDISKIISNWSCSFLMIDEILDSGVDQDGISQFIATLYNIVTEQNKELGIYVISHKLSEIQVPWNEYIEINKKSLFSELKSKKCEN